MAISDFFQFRLTHKGVEVCALAKIDLHDRSNHLIEKCLREACFLQVFMESLVKQFDIVIPSNGLQQLFYAAEGIVMGLVTVDPCKKEKWSLNNATRDTEL